MAAPFVDTLRGGCNAFYRVPFFKSPMGNDARITNLRSEDTVLIDRLAQLAYSAFTEHAPSWLPTLDDARRQVLKSLEPNRISRVLLNPVDSPIGWIAAIPLNHGRIWEIHPLVVSIDEQGKGYGRIYHRRRYARRRRTGKTRH